MGSCKTTRNRQMGLQTKKFTDDTVPKAPKHGSCKIPCKRKMGLQTITKFTDDTVPRSSKSWAHVRQQAKEIGVADYNKEVHRRHST